MLLSIITVSYNDLYGLKKTIESVSNQTIDSYDSFEVIVIDGGTEDFIIDISKKINSTVISQQDKGIYDAMNKGVSFARGDFCLFLNGGDQFFDSASLSQILNMLKTMEPNAFLYWKALLIHEETSTRYTYPSSKVTQYNHKKFLKHKHPCHQAICIPLSFCKKTPYDIALSISADAKFKNSMIEVLDSKFIDETLTVFCMDGVSSSIKNFAMLKKRILNSYYAHKSRDFSSFMLVWSYSIIRSITSYLLYAVGGEKLLYKAKKKLRNIK